MNLPRNRLEQMSRVLLATILLASLAGCELFDYEPTADFAWSPTTAYARVDVQFTDQSHDVSGMFKDGEVISWEWRFGDGTKAWDQHPVHTYEFSGTYNVVLIVQDSVLLDDSTMRQVHVLPSIHGLWIGRIDDPYGFELDMALHIFYAQDGSFTGFISIADEKHPLSGGSFDPETRQAVLECFAFPITLTGSLNANELVLSGQWEQGVSSGTWSVILQETE